MKILTANIDCFPALNETAKIPNYCRSNRLFEISISIWQHCKPIAASIFFGICLELCFVFRSKAKHFHFHFTHNYKEIATRHHQTISVVRSSHRTKQSY